MSPIKSFFNHPYFTWAVLSIPGLMMLFGLATSDDPRIFHILVHPTGEFSARFLIICMMITPMVYLFRNARWPRWMLKRRRYLGVASAGYALLHTLFYLIDKGSLSTVIAELTRSYIWLGWIAFIVFVPLTLTSTDSMVRRLGRNWKRVQQTVYIAAVLTLLHWAALHNWNGWGPALANFAPLIALSVFRIWYEIKRRQPKPVAA